MSQFVAYHHNISCPVVIFFVVFRAVISCHAMPCHATSCAHTTRGSHDQTPTSYSQAYNTAISVIRTVYAGPLVLDLPGWGQETTTAEAASPLLADSHLIFSAHIYPEAYNQVAGRYVLPEDMRYLFNHGGRPCILGEFGDIQAEASITTTSTAATATAATTTTAATGVTAINAVMSDTGRHGRIQEGKEGDACDVKAVVQAAQAVGFAGVYGWAWNGDGGHLNMLDPSWTVEPTSLSYAETDYFWTILELL